MRMGDKMRTRTPGTPTNTSTSPGSGNNQSVSEVANEQASEIANTLFGLFNSWGFPTWGTQLILTILILLFAWYVSRLVSQVMGRRIARRFQRPSVSRTILRVIRGGVIGIGVFFILANIYRVPISNIALSVTVFSATVGVVLAPLVGSLISGLFVLADQPYEVGDMIEIVDTGQRGYVEDITIRYTKLFTIDNTLLVIPNGSIRDRDVINYSGEDSRTRLHLDIGVTYESDIDEARRLIEDAAREVDVVVEGGPDIRIGSARYAAQPTCYIDQFGSNSVQLRLRYWVKEPYKLLVLRSKIQEKMWERLEDADVEIAYPHSHVVFDDTSGQLNVSMGNDITDSNGEQPPEPASKEQSQSQPMGTQPRIDD